MNNWPEEWAPLPNEVSDRLSKIKMIIFDVEH